MHYVDASVFLYPVVYADVVEEARLARGILLKIARGELQACTASLTWDEFVWVIRRLRGAAVAGEEGRRLLRFPNLRILSVDGVLGEAQRVMEAYGVGPRDAIHVACALRHGVRELISDDEELDRVKEVRRLGLRHFRRQ